MKKIISGLVATGLFSFVYAQSMQSNSFFGLEVGSTTLKADTTNQKGSESSGAEFGLRVGAQNQLWRTTFALNFFNGDDNAYQKGLLLLDYNLLAQTQYATEMFKPFVGVNAGYMSYESGDSLEASGFVYGGQIGVSVEFSPNIFVDVSYRYTTSSSDEVDTMTGVMLGLNYIY